MLKRSNKAFRLKNGLLPRGLHGATIRVPDAYNMYFSPNGKSAIVVAEGFKRLEFRDSQTMALKSVLPVPQCRGINSPLGGHVFCLALTL